ncbi:alpha-ketoglutarate-dependent dioxygenase AlkB family protein [Aquirufa ecclesiirivi]|uniref:Alpha-ketoglutarate-dependent dioxygenase AlkB n=1 Tax=Aquirufa ecclesiirivi TaxID=2715124 RepID=A0ABT4JE95_9BACT|nr:alpha-ketoglutarate-dependent dioxygenase AlkB [Aquirufa ecclesiirivi]MCZ2474447.1 alpha-ketoglutarate-dependent dioxygenase AlkB [Aquirufa ecclesiirivi]MDF0694555.1 alpha-ketoglutarate-dependent dioxygenase AlkB [Aquirufa ecclesiirivi]
MHINKQKDNLLPFDGELYSYGRIYTEEQANTILNTLIQSIAWEHDVVRLFGKTHITARKVAWYSDLGRSYQYSGSVKQAHTWTPLLWEIKSQVEEICQAKYNACLLNLYHNGNEGMGWHADNEKSIVTHSSIASLSLGCQRRFDLKHNSSGEKRSLELENGQLINMQGCIQDHWKHALAKSKKIHELRINLTFRLMI